MLWPPLLRVTVAERSMEPALRPGDWLLVWRTSRVRAGQHDLARADPVGAPDQQPVAGPEGGLHGMFGDRDAKQRRPVHASLPGSALPVSAQASGVVSGLQANESEKGNR